MSKSAGNFFTLRDLLGKGFLGREIRYLLLSAHYRESFNFTLEGLQGARTALARIDACGAKLKEGSEGAVGGDGGGSLVAEVADALDDDLNVSAAWGAVFGWIREQNRLISEGRMTAGEAAGAASALATVLGLFGLRPAVEAEEIPDEVRRLAQARQEARKAKDFARADVLRDALKAQGWVVEDTPKGPKFKRV